MWISFANSDSPAIRYRCRSVLFAKAIWLKHCLFARPLSGAIGGLFVGWLAIARVAALSIKRPTAPLAKNFDFLTLP